MKNHCPDYPQIYVSINLRCNHEIIYLHHMGLQATMQVLGRHQAALTKVCNSFQSQWSYRLVWTELTSIR